MVRPFNPKNIRARNISFRKCIINILSNLSYLLFKDHSRFTLSQISEYSINFFILNCTSLVTERTFIFSIMKLVELRITQKSFP